MSTAMAVSPALNLGTDQKLTHAEIKQTMLEVLAVVLDIQASYESYERPSEVNHDLLEPLWRSRIENAFGTGVTFSTTPHAKQSWKYVLEVSFVLEIGQCRYKVAAIGTDAPNGYNSTAEWIRQVKRWPESEKQMEKKGIKNPVEPRSLGHGATMKQESIDALQDACKKDLEEQYNHLRQRAVEVFSNSKFDGRTIDSVNMQSSVGGFTLWFNEPLEGEGKFSRYLQLQGGFEAFEDEWLPRFSGDENAPLVYRALLDKAIWLGKWIDGMVEIKDKPKPRPVPVVEKQSEVIETPQPESTTTQPEKAKQGELTAQFYTNPRTGECRSFLVKGDTYPLRDQLKDMNGTWCKGLGGWIFGLKRENQFRMAFPTVEWVASGTTQLRAA